MSMIDGLCILRSPRLVVWPWPELICREHQDPVPEQG